MINFQREITVESYVWQPNIAGRTHDVPVSTFISPGALAPDTTQTHLYLGMGEGSAATRKGLKIMSQMGLHAVGVVIPFHHLPCDAANIERTLIEVPLAIAEEMNQRAGNTPTPPIDAGAHSQNGGGIFLSAGNAPERYRNVAGWSPVGFTTEFLGETLEERRSEFWRRLLVENAQLPDQSVFIHPGNLIAGAGIVTRVGADKLAGRLDAKIDYALSDFDGIGYFKKALQGGVNGMIFGPEDDRLFRLYEFLLVMSRAGLLPNFTQLPGSHSSPLAPAGRLQLQIVTTWLKQARLNSKAV